MANLNTLIQQVALYVESYMNNFDGSHDFNHIKRVLGLSHAIYTEILISDPDTKLDKDVITLGALLHDVGDRKYLKEGEDSNTLVRNLLLSFGAEKGLADQVQTICAGVSYTSEVKDLERVKALIEEFPELAVVQDADRLDAIGAVGIGRVFTYGGARTTRSMDETMLHFDEKLMRLEAMMKTGPGKRLATERTMIMKQFMGWWHTETMVVPVAEGFLRDAGAELKKR